MRPFYTVSILTDTGWQYSRSFQTVAAARRWARWCAASWQAVIHKGGPGGEKIATFQQRAA